MKECPIIFSAPEVKAILGGRKTQTRHVVKLPQREHFLWIGEDYLEIEETTGRDRRKYHLSRPGVPGDRLWVRETWGIARPLRDSEGIVDDEQEWSGPIPKQDPRGKRLFDDWCVGYAADGCDGRMRSPLFMPRWASRITLELVSVRVERLQDISEADAKAEGVEPLQMDGSSFLPRFEGLWDSLNGKRAPWESNPFVWVLEFRTFIVP